MPVVPGSADDEWHALNFVVDKTALGVFLTQGLGASFTCAELTLHLEKSGIETRTLFVFMPTQCPGFEYPGYRLGQFPHAEFVGLHGIHSGVHQDVGTEEMEYVLESLGCFIAPFGQ